MQGEALAKRRRAKEEMSRNEHTKSRKGKESKKTQERDTEDKEKHEQNRKKQSYSDKRNVVVKGTTSSGRKMDNKGSRSSKFWDNFMGRTNDKGSRDSQH